MLPTDSYPYLLQWICVRRGRLDVAGFAGAWQGGVARHPALRAGFVGEGPAEPLQVVRRRVELPWIHEDWRQEAPAARRRRLPQSPGGAPPRGFDRTRARLRRR